MLRCKHCLLPTYESEAIYDEQGNVFCCEGCRGVYNLIHQEGLERFYIDRKWEPQAGFKGTELFKGVDAREFEALVKADDKGLLGIELYIENIRCAACVWLNEKVLHRTKGIVSARVNYATHKAQIRWRPDEVGLQDILNKIVSIGYRPKPYSESEHLRQQKSETRDLLIRFGTAAFLSSQLMVYTIALYAGYFQDIDRDTKLILEVIALFLTAPVVFYSGAPFIKNTVIGLRHLHFTMDTLIAVGALSAFVFSIYQIIVGGKVYFDTAAMIVTLILLGRYIESSAKGKASEAIGLLGDLMPKEARLLQNGQETSVPVESLKIGQLIRVLPGERIPIDGQVLEGQTETDESLITGESRPVPKQINSPVIGGSINLQGSILIEVTKGPKETVLSGIIEAVREAQMRAPRIQGLSDRVVGVFVPLILLISAGTVVGHLIRGAALHEALMTGISVVVIACPCSLGLATPLAILIATTVTSSRGLLIKGGDVIERVSFIETVVFDKTGTLTRGMPQLKEVLVFASALKPEEALSIAASLERHSEHTIAKALVEAARGLNVYKTTDVEAMPGKGIRGLVEAKEVFLGNRSLMDEQGIMVSVDETVISDFQRAGNTVVFLGFDGAVKACFVVADMLREEARPVVERLKGQGLEVCLLSGDNMRTTEAIALEAGIHDFTAETTPRSKQEFIRTLQSKGQRVLMVGDGINDAPSLTEATVGVAMTRGTDIAMESADVVLMREDLWLIPLLLRLSKKTYTVIRQNIFMSFLYNISAVPLAMTGLLHPIIAAAAMAISSLCVVGNSLRIRRL